MFKTIVICFLQLPKDDEILSQKLREEARAIFLQRRGRQLLNNNELKVCMEVEFVLYIVGSRYQAATGEDKTSCVLQYNDL